jgi:hypothetical protein
VNLALTSGVFCYLVPSLIRRRTPYAHMHIEGGMVADDWQPDDNCFTALPTQICPASRASSVSRVSKQRGGRWINHAHAKPCPSLPRHLGGSPRGIGTGDNPAAPAGRVAETSDTSEARPLVGTLAGGFPISPCQNPEGITMTGTYFANPDCLETAAPVDLTRTRSELLAAARSTGKDGILVITEREFDQIRSEVGLGYRWKGARLFVR